MNGIASLSWQYPRSRLIAYRTMREIAEVEICLSKLLQRMIDQVEKLLEHRMELAAT